MKKLIAVVVAVTPAFAFAQTQPITDINSLAYRLTNLGNTFIQILIALAVIWIIYNVVRYIIKADSDDRKPIGQAILWGIVGLFVILSVWGLVRILKNTFGTNTNGPTQDEIPQSPLPSSVF